MLRSRCLRPPNGVARCLETLAGSCQLPVPSSAVQDAIDLVLC